MEVAYHPNWGGSRRSLNPSLAVAFGTLVSSRNDGLWRMEQRIEWEEGSVGGDQLPAYVVRTLERVPT